VRILTHFFISFIPYFQNRIDLSQSATVLALLRRENALIEPRAWGSGESSKLAFLCKGFQEALGF
jgi:hypothetical protein